MRVSYSGGSEKIEVLVNKEIPVSGFHTGRRRRGWGRWRGGNRLFSNPWQAFLQWNRNGVQSSHTKLCRIPEQKGSYGSLPLRVKVF